SRQPDGPLGGVLGDGDGVFRGDPLGPLAPASEIRGRRIHRLGTDAGALDGRRRAAAASAPVLRFRAARRHLFPTVPGLVLWLVARVARIARAHRTVDTAYRTVHDREADLVEIARRGLKYVRKYPL